METLWGRDWSQVKQLFYCLQPTIINFMIKDYKERADLYSSWAHLISGPTLSHRELFDPDQVCCPCLWHRNKHGVTGRNAETWESCCLLRDAPTGRESIKIKKESLFCSTSGHGFSNQMGLFSWHRLDVINSISGSFLPAHSAVGTSFWTDYWRPPQRLMDIRPDIVQISDLRVKEAFLFKCGEELMDGNHNHFSLPL